MHTATQTAGLILVNAMVPTSRGKLVRRRIVLPHDGQAPDRAADRWAKQNPGVAVTAVHKDGTQYVWN